MNNYDSKLMRFLKHLVILLVVAFVLFPIIWTISASINPANTIVGQNIIPDNASLVHYNEFFTSDSHPFLRWMWNSIKISLVTAFFSVSMTALASYPFSRFKFKGRRNGLFVFLLIQIFPQMLAMTAIYLLFLNIQNYIPAIGLNTHTALVLTYLGGSIGVNTWLMKGYLDTIPRSLEEAAYIDGAGKFEAFRKIILPLARPILSALFVIQFIGTYSEYILASILLNTSEKFTLAVGLQMFISDMYGKRMGVFSAAALVGAIPIVILFMVFQDYIVNGLVGGGVKE